MNTPTPQAESGIGTRDSAAPGTRLDRRGVALGVSTYLMWGILPIYFVQLDSVRPLEIIAHRVLWSMAFCLLMLVATRTMGTFVAAIRNPRVLGLLTLSGALVAVNWTTYVSAILNEQVIEASLGYFINPLVTALLAVVVLGERLRTIQWVALGLGVLAVLVITAEIGRPPWIALILAGAFGFYGLVKKRVGRDVAALAGLTVETAVLAPACLIYLGWLAAEGVGAWGSSPRLSLLLASTGIMTAVPLMMFSEAARRLPLSVLGMLQYLGPLVQFGCGILVFGERMPVGRWVGFALVWLALALVTGDAVRTAHRTRTRGRAGGPTPGDDPGAPRRSR